MSELTVNQLLEEAKKLGEPMVLRVPLTVLMSEAVQVANFIKSHWEPCDRRPGLKTVGARLPLTLIDELIRMRDVLQAAQNEYEMCINPKINTPEMISRARFVLSEITAILDWYLDDGVEDENDAKFAALNTAHVDDNDAASTLAQALFDYATLAKPLAGELDGLGEFDASMIEEAFVLADQLGQVPATPTERSEAAKDLKWKRDLLASLLQTRIVEIRATARFVYRRFPDVYREVTSAYERKRRAAAKRAKMENAAAAE